MMYFDGSRIVFDNYVSNKRVASNYLASMVLGFFEAWKRPNDIVNAFPDYQPKPLLATVRKLQSNGLLITRDSKENELEDKMEKYSQWPLPSRYYHFSTKTTDFVITPESSRQYYNKFLKDGKQPPLYKSYPEKTKIKLLSTFKREEASLFDTLLKRKSIRDFSERPISFEELSKIIYYTWGRMSYYETGEFGLLIHKTSPSAGARHPTEMYLVANNVTGVGRGIYHYSVKDHSLELLKTGDFREKCLAYCAGQKWAKAASGVFIMTSVVARTTWKYRVPRTYRSLLLDVGHLSQTFFLVCTGMGLGPFCTGVMCDSLIESELGIDGVAETIIFVVGVGRPKAKQEKPAMSATLL